MKILRSIASLFCMMGTLVAVAQISVEQRIDSVGILIGQQAHLSVKVTAPKGARILWPEFKPSQHITPGVEILETSNADTASLDDRLMAVTKIFTLTSFDEKLYPIPGMKINVNGKTYAGNTSALKVITVDVDTLHPNQFFPPKDVQDNTFLWSEWSPLFWQSVFLLFLCLVGIYLFVRLRQNKPVIAKVRIVKKVPPHQKALNAIARIKEERLQRSEDQKAYYTQLTDTLRHYINERFGFNAMEMTSSEIIEHLQHNGDQTMINELRELFQTADLVKFAKYQSLINENDLNLVNAVNFIDETKLEGQPIEERVAPQVTAEAKRSRKSRMAILSAICVIALCSVALLIYIIYSAYQLVI